MNWYFDTEKKPTDVLVKITAKNECKVQMCVSCLDTDVVFALRVVKIQPGTNDVYMKVPFAPKNMIVNVLGSIANNIQVSVFLLPCRSYNIPIGKTQIEFIEFCQSFAWSTMNAKITPSDAIFKSKNENFKAVLMPKITDYYGRAIGSPASIDSEQKVILIDYDLITKFTMSGMVALMCHEYAHCYANEKEGYPASSEEGADKFGLRLFLAAGYGESEYLAALGQTFKRVDTNENRRRFKFITEHAEKINKGLLYGKPY
jgi:hypothetical protein